MLLVVFAETRYRSGQLSYYCLRKKKKWVNKQNKLNMFSVRTMDTVVVFNHKSVAFN